MQYNLIVQYSKSAISHVLQLKEFGCIAHLAPPKLGDPIPVALPVKPILVFGLAQPSQLQRFFEGEIVLSHTQRKSCCVSGRAT